jgi:HK97 family phage major capsid protein
MKTLKELKEERARIVASMENLVNSRSENMDEETVSAVKSFKDEVLLIDSQIEAVEELRSVAIKGSAPVEVKEKNAAVEFRSNFTQYLRGNISQRAMSAGTAGAGLETVPDEFYRTLLDKILEYGRFYSEANVLTTANHGEFQIPTADDTGNAGAWTAENGAITAADFTTAQKTMGAYKVTTAILCSAELLEDSAFDIESYIAGALGTRLARTFESAFINGDGTGKPLGIVADPLTTANTSAAIGVVDVDDARDLMFSLTPMLREGAKFYASDSMIKNMLEWVDTTGRPLLQPLNGSTQANDIQYSLFGKPVTPNYELGSAVTGGEVPLIFGNPSMYYIRNVRNITVKRGDEVNMLNDQVLFTATTRLDGKVVSANPAFAKMTVRTV